MRWIMTLAVLLFSGCHAKQDHTIELWAHAGQARERSVLEAQVKRFNRLYPGLRAKLTLLPERTYNAQVQAAAVAGSLPDVLELDGPYAFNYIWQGFLQPISPYLEAAVKRDLLPSVIDQGTLNGRLYTVAVFDSGLALFVRREKLLSLGISIPSNPEQAWSVDTFSEILKKLAASDADGAVLDLKLNYPDEWFSYGFSPALQSAGGDLIDRKTYQRAKGVLNSNSSVRALGHIQYWIKTGLVDPNLDDAAFVGERVAISWVGHWEYRRYTKAFDDVVIVPLPDFGTGTKTGQGSWVWAVTKNAKHATAVKAWLSFILQPAEILKMTDANGAVPARRSAVQLSPRFRQGGPLHLYVSQLQSGISVPRPKTPAYPVISSAFHRVFQQLRDGGDIRTALNKAAEKIEQNIRDNRGYPFSALPGG